MAIGDQTSVLREGLGHPRSAFFSGPSGQRKPNPDRWQLTVRTRQADRPVYDQA